MNPSCQLESPDRLQIREGGGCMSWFGLPFFAAGILMMLTVVGVVPVSNADEQSAYVWVLLIVMSVAFITVGGALVFGRRWTTIDRAQRAVIKQWGLLVPLHEQSTRFDGYTAVRLGFVEGDSDSADRFPVALKATAGAEMQLADFTSYTGARECVRMLAEHLRLDVEDASTDHPTRLAARQFDMPLQERLRQEGVSPEAAGRPPNARSHVTRDGDQVTVVIPSRPMRGLVVVAGLLPLAIPLVLGPPLATFFRESNTPGPVGWAFLTFLTVCFGILPSLTIVSAFLRSRRGATIVEASPQRLRILERGAWRTSTVASHDAADVLDVDYSSRQSAFAPGKGLTVKTRTGLTTIGKGLDDEEVRYLHSVIRQALMARSESSKEPF